MGKPFVVSEDPVPIGQNESSSRFPRDICGSPDVLSHNRRLTSAIATPPQDALHGGKACFEEGSKGSSRKSSSRHRRRSTLLDLLVDDTGKPTELATTQQRTSFGEILQMQNLDCPSGTESTNSKGQTHIGLESASEFSGSDSDTGLHESMLSPPTVRISDEDEVSSQEVVSGANSSSSVEGVNFENRVECSADVELNSVKSVDFKDCQMETEQSHHLREEASNSAFEWNQILKRSARSLDSLSDGSFTTARFGMSPASSRGSLSDEAISERTAAWGKGVARLVIKNSSRESTPRTSDGSLADGLHYGQKVPGVSKHAKDALSSFQLAFVVCDVIDRENPILYASAGFFDMTGYAPEEVIGRNCRFLQGVDTDPKEVARIRMAISKGEGYSGTVLNYKKNGTPFWNLLTLSPMSDDKGAIIKYMGMHAEVNQSVAARRKKAALDTAGKDVPRSICKSIAEVTPSKRSERGADVPVFNPPKSRLAGTPDRLGGPQGNKRYSLTYGILGSKRHSLSPETQALKRHSIATPERRRPRESWSGERANRGDERKTVRTGKKSAVRPQPPPSKSPSAARPLYWILTAARILEEEISRLGCDPNFAKELPQKSKRQNEGKAHVKHKNKINRMARGVLGLFRKLERKVFHCETSRAGASSSRVRAYDFESDMEIDLPEVGTRNKYYSERQDLRCDTMPHLNPTMVPSVSSSVIHADLRARSNRYVSSAMTERFDKRISSSHSNEFVLDRKQFCIVHE